ncbi:hypothetical protein PENSPDRAFT_682342 [Peniophora sp. CONT]|nr:hypothetical protein PENSPDRAFT_682342 [Peniophora sp. CONT]
MDEASLLRMQKSDLETLARAKGLSDYAIIHFNKPRLIAALLDPIHPARSDTPLFNDVKPGFMGRSSTRQSMVASGSSVPPVGQVDTKRRRSQSKQRSARPGGDKRRRTGTGHADVNGSGYGAGELRETEAEVEADVHHNQARAQVAAATLPVPANATTVEIITPYANYDTTAANTDTDIATLPFQDDNTTSATSEPPSKRLRSIHDDENGPAIASKTSEHEVSPCFDNPPLKKLYEDLRVNEQTAESLLVLLSAKPPWPFPGLLHPYALFTDESSLHEAMLGVLADTKEVLTRISAKIYLSPPMVLPPLPGPTRPIIDQIYESQAELVQRANYISRRLVSAHKYKWQWTKGYKWDQVLEVLDTLMKGMEATKMDISRMIDERDEAQRQALEIIAQEADESDEPEEEQAVDGGDGTGRRASGPDESENRIAAWAWAVENSEIIPESIFDGHG